VAFKDKKKRQEEEERIYWVDPKKEPEELTELEKIAVEHCGGNLNAACTYLVETADAATMDAYADNFTPSEAAIFLIAFMDLADKKIPKKRRKAIISKNIMIAHMDMTEEQIAATEKNPFVPKLWISAGLLLFCSIGIGVVVGLGKRFLTDQSAIETISSLLGCVSTCLVFKVVADASNVFRFWKTKRIISEEKLIANDTENAD